MNDLERFTSWEPLRARDLLEIQAVRRVGIDGLLREQTREDAREWIRQAFKTVESKGERA